MSPPSRKAFLLSILSIFASLAAANDEGSCADSSVDVDDLSTWETPPPPKSCRLFLAPRNQINDGSDVDADGSDGGNYGRKLGVFAAVDSPRGMPITPRGGDVILHLIDVDPHLDLDGENTSSQSQLRKWLSHGFLVDAITSGHGGNYEGLGTILTALPGVGMLGASSHSTELASTDSYSVRPNVWASVPETDEANLPRYTSPLAGSFSLHYNLTHVISDPKGIEKGGEVLVDRDGWHRRKALSLGGNDDSTMSMSSQEENVNNDNPPEVNNNNRINMDTQQLFRDGVCMDNVHYGPSEHDYGRGAIASRFLQKGSIVAPVLVLPIPRKELRYLRSKEWKKVKAFRRKLKKKDEQTKKESNPDIVCPDGQDPIPNTFCGRGPNRADCADNQFCFIEPADRWAVCCPNQGGKQLDKEIMLPPGVKWREQLMLNYCLGHENSSVLLFPYGHVNYMNHAPSIEAALADEGHDGPVANVGLRWSEKLTRKDESGVEDPRSVPPSRLWERPNPEGLVLEMVALTDIYPNDELYLNYGAVWRRAWEEHVLNWNADSQNSIGRASDDDYSPAYVMEDVVSNLRTADEQIQYPYPDNIFTACFYHYQRSGNAPEKSQQQQQKSSSKRTEAIPWKMTAGLFDMMNLRPCKVISRETAPSRNPQQQQSSQPGQGKMYYTAIVQNRPGLPLNERIPKGEKHIVSGIPREAFRFVDRPYTSDVHLDGAFQHNIGLEEAGIFPEAWLDML